MTPALKIESQIHFVRRGHGSRKELHPGEEPVRPTKPGRVPRISRLMALAIRFDQYLRDGVVSSYGELAHLGYVTTARVSQIMSLLQLAPDIQEQILFLPRTVQGRDSVHLRQMLSVTSVLDWQKQRKLWEAHGNERGLKSEKK